MHRFDPPRGRRPAKFATSDKRRVYSAAYKLDVVTYALAQPPDQRIRPTCRAYPGLEPVQLRKWIRNLSALKSAAPRALLVRTNVRGAKPAAPRVPSPSAPPRVPLPAPAAQRGWEPFYGLEGAPYYYPAALAPPPARRIDGTCTPYGAGSIRLGASPPALPIDLADRPLFLTSCLRPAATPPPPRRCEGAKAASWVDVLGAAQALVGLAQ